MGIVAWVLSHQKQPCTAAHLAEELAKVGVPKPQLEIQRALDRAEIDMDGWMLKCFG